MISSPQPSVLHLVTLFRQISSGDIRIPAFQREFVWKHKQMIELLESVSEQFPIGSILLWNVDKKILKLAPSETTSFPDVEERFPVSYVLDGMQRLSTLYGVFHFGSSTSEQMFDVSYDLSSNTFFHTSDSDFLSERAIPLSALFSPRALLAHQSRLSGLPDGEQLIDQLLTLQASFQEYMVPVVTIRSTDVHRIVGIFEKINSTGTRLDPVDFMRAITWAEDFDLNHHLEQVMENLSGVRFDIDPETIIKCVGLCLDIPPTTIGLLALRYRSPSELRSAFEVTREGLLRVSEFCLNYLHIHSAKAVPYEGQLLLLFKTIGLSLADDEEKSFVQRWFWSVGFNESLRGKPDHYVARAVENWKGLVRGRVRGLEPRLKLSSTELLERRIVSGGALSSAFAAMHAAHNSLDLVSGESIPPGLFMNDSSANWFEPLFSKTELKNAGISADVSARLFANLLLVDRRHSDFTAEWARTLIDHWASVERWDVLESNFITRVASEALRNGDIFGFLDERARTMTHFAQQLVEG